MDDKVVFLLTHMPNPRINKRIEALRKICAVEVICVRRKKSDIWMQHHGDVQHRIFELDFPPSSRLLRRIAASFRFAFYAVKQLKNIKPKLVYLAGFDNLLVASWYMIWHKKVKIVYEVADIMKVFYQSKSIVRKILSVTEKFAYQKVNLLVLTSEKFYLHYFSGYFSRSQTIIMHNVPNFEYFRSYQRKSSCPFTVGFIGGIRFLDQMKMLVDASQESEVRVLFAGTGETEKDTVEIQDYCIGKTDIEFTGRFDYAKDIANLYGLIDCVFAVYDANTYNAKLALPNKLYEAAYCGLPIIVAKGTYLSELVDEYGLGFSINHLNKEELVELLRRLSTLKHDKLDFSKAGEVFLNSLDQTPSDSLRRKIASLLDDE